MCFVLSRTVVFVKNIIFSHVIARSVFIMALEGVKSDKNDENNGNIPDGKPNGTDNKSKQVHILLSFLF